MPRPAAPARPKNSGIDRPHLYGHSLESSRPQSAWALSLSIFGPWLNSVASHSWQRFSKTHATSLRSEDQRQHPDYDQKANEEDDSCSTREKLEHTTSTPAELLREQQTPV